MYVVHLAIDSLDWLTIAVVDAPFALMRGGASPRPFASHILILLTPLLSSILMARGWACLLPSAATPLPFFT